MADEEGVVPKQGEASAPRARAADFQAPAACPGAVLICAALVAARSPSWGDVAGAAVCPCPRAGAQRHRAWEDANADARRHPARVGAEEVATSWASVVVD